MISMVSKDSKKIMMIVQHNVYDSFQEMPFVVLHVHPYFHFEWSWLVGAALVTPALHFGIDFDYNTLALVLILTIIRWPWY